MGPPGSGKTDSTLTLVEAGIETFVLVTEPTGTDSLIDSAKRRKLSLDKLHWRVIPPAAPGWKALGDALSTTKSMSYEDISKIKQGIGKREMHQLEDFVQSLQSFVCERTRKDFGDVTSWDDSRALVLDSLSGLSLFVMHHTVGFKSSPHQGEWGIAMSLLEQLLLKLSSDCRCFFVLIAHTEREPDEIAGSSRITVSTLGRKLAPKIPRYFSEFVLARRTAQKFTWSTAANDSDLKSRALPVSNELEPTFVPVVEAHRRRKAEIASTAASAA
jgi:hypothetical protein